MKARLSSGCAVAIAATVLAACGGAGSDATAAPASIPPGPWVILGSSTATGAGATPGHAWPEQLQASHASHATPLINLAKGGSTTYAGLGASGAPVPGRPEPDPAANVDAALARSPTLVLVAYPSNDTALGYGVDETVRNVLAMREAVLSRGVAVVVLSTQPRALPAAQLALLPQIDTRLAQAVGPCFVAVREALAGPAATLDARYDSGDGVHPNDAGHALIHDRVRRVLDGGGCVRFAP
jgi:lysophospholipase L1-like esterase